MKAEKEEEEQTHRVRASTNIPTLEVVWRATRHPRHGGAHPVIQKNERAERSVGGSGCPALGPRSYPRAGPFTGPSSHGVWLIYSQQYGGVPYSRFSDRSFFFLFSKFFVVF